MLLQSHFLRSRERDDKAIAAAMGKLGSGGSSLRELISILTIKPAQDKDSITQAIDSVVDKVYL